MFKIVGDERNFPEFHQFYELGKQFVPFAQKKLGFNKPVDVELVSDPQNAKDPLGKTAYYDPNNMKITLFVDKRHIKDILRSLSHELVHHAQNCRGDFEKGHDLGEGSFSTNKALRELEFEAYRRGNGEIVREFEEQYKKSKEVSEMKLDEQLSKDEVGKVFKKKLNYVKVQAACRGLDEREKDPERRKQPLRGEIWSAEVMKQYQHSGWMPVVGFEHAYQLAQCAKAETFRYTGPKKEIIKGKQRVIQITDKEYSSDIYKSEEDTTRGIPDSGFTMGGREDARLQESLDNFVDSILNEINSDSYLLEQDILKENKNMREAIDMEKADIDNSGKVEDWEMARAQAAFGDKSDDDVSKKDEDTKEGKDPIDEMNCHCGDKSGKPHKHEVKQKRCPVCKKVKCEVGCGKHENLQEQEGGPDKLRAPKPGGECYVKVGEKGYQFKEEKGQPFYKNLKCLADALGEKFTHKEGTNDIIEKKDDGKQGIHSFPQAKPKPGPKPPAIKEETNENWFKGNKDQLLFEELVKRWTK